MPITTIKNKKVILKRSVVLDGNIEIDEKHDGSYLLGIYDAKHFHTSLLH